jgi:hypothetical protein
MCLLGKRLFFSGVYELQQMEEPYTAYGQKDAIVAEPAARAAPTERAWRGT